MDLVTDKQKLLVQIEQEAKEEAQQEQKHQQEQEEAQKENLSLEIIPYIDLIHKGLFYGVFQFKEVEQNYIDEANRLLLQIIEKRFNFLVQVVNKGGVEMAYIGTLATIYIMNEGKKLSVVDTSSSEKQQEQPAKEETQEAKDDD